MTDLSPCPFCNSTKLKLDYKGVLAGWNGLDERVENHTYSVRCNVCHARGPAFGGKVIPHRRHPDSMALPGWATTDEKLKASAVEGWNCRENPQ